MTTSIFWSGLLGNIHMPLSLFPDIEVICTVSRFGDKTIDDAKKIILTGTTKDTTIYLYAKENRGISQEYFMTPGEILSDEDHTTHHILKFKIKNMIQTFICYYSESFMKIPSKCLKNKFTYAHCVIPEIIDIFKESIIIKPQEDEGDTNKRVYHAFGKYKDLNLSYDKYHI